MAIGIENPTAVDLVTMDPLGEEVALIMVATEPWTDEKVLALQSKTKSYLDYIESGQFRSAYPDASAKRVRIQLDTSYPLSKVAGEFVSVASEQWLKPLGLRFVVEEVR